MKTYILTEDQEMLCDLAKKLVGAEIRPRSEAVDRGEKSLAEGFGILAESGMTACMIPEEYGGSGLDAWSQTFVLETVAGECASTAWAAAMNAEVAACVLKHGSSEAKKQTLPELAGGELAAVARTSEISACLEGDNLILDGQAEHVALAGMCGWYLLPVSAKDGTRWVLVKSGTDGLHVETEGIKLGLRGCPMGIVTLKRVSVPVSMELTGKVETTLSAAQALDSAAISVGVAEGAIREAVAYVNQRVQFRKTIAQFENTQQRMAELMAGTEAARSLVWSAAQVKGAGEDETVAAALAKVAASDSAGAVTRKCIQFMGGYGYSREYPVERKMRDAKMLEILGGTVEGQKEEIARHLVVKC